jgi:hypothetical protein
MQSAPRKDNSENVPSGSDPLAVLTANANCEINFVHYAGTGFSVRRANLLRRTLISKRRIIERSAHRKPIGSKKKMRVRIDNALPMFQKTPEASRT